MQEFLPSLPGAFKLIEADGKERSSEGNTNGRKRPGEELNTERPPKQTRNLGKRVHNTSVCAKLKLKQGKKWCWFKHPLAVRQLPAWKGTHKKCCHHFLVNGQCFELCPSADSHVPCDQVPAATNTSLIAWMDEVRARNT